MTALLSIRKCFSALNINDQKRTNAKVCCLPDPYKSGEGSVEK
jgi:hypothetical protein